MGFFMSMLAAILLKRIFRPCNNYIFINDVDLFVCATEQITAYFSVQVFVAY